MYTRTCYDTYMRLCQPVFDYPGDRTYIIIYKQNVIMHEVFVLNKHKGFTQCLEVIPHRQSSQHWASSVSDAARSRYPWTGESACVCSSLLYENTWKKTQ